MVKTLASQMRIVGQLALLGVVFVVGSAVAADAASSRADLDRTRALVEAGALSKSALAEAERTAERADLQKKLRATISKKNLKPTELPEMLRVAARLRDLAYDRFIMIQARVEAGAAPFNELLPAKQDYDLANKQLELAQSRSKLVQELASMALAEDRFEELESEELAFSYEGEGDPLAADILAVDMAFYEQFGLALPISAEGATDVHESLGFDHAGRFDIALHPDDPEGLFLIAVLESWGIPYIAFRSAVPGQSTGPHIHIGAPSPHVPPEEGY